MIHVVHETYDTHETQSQNTLESKSNSKVQRTHAWQFDPKVSERPRGRAKCNIMMDDVPMHIVKWNSMMSDVPSHIVKLNIMMADAPIHIVKLNIMMADVPIHIVKWNIRMADVPIHIVKCNIMMKLLGFHRKSIVFLPRNSERQGAELGAAGRAGFRPELPGERCCSLLTLLET